MKSLLTLAVLLSTPIFSYAACEAAAKKAAQKEARMEVEDFQVLEASCSLATNKKVYVCKAYGVDSNYEGSRDYQVVTSLNCKKIFSVKLTGIE